MFIPFILPSYCFFAEPLVPHLQEKLRKIPRGANLQTDLEKKTPPPMLAGPPEAGFQIQEDPGETCPTGTKV